MTLVDGAQGLFAPVDEATIAQVPAQFVPSRTGLDRVRRPLDRARLQQGRRCRRRELPASIMDLADPEWKGQVGIAPTGADFQAIVSAVVAVEGESAAQAWLDGPQGQRQDLPATTSR